MSFETKQCVNINEFCQKILKNSIVHHQELQFSCKLYVTSDINSFIRNNGHLVLCPRRSLLGVLHQVHQ